VSDLLLGVSKVDINLEKQLVEVEASADPGAIQQTIEKTGKKTTRLE